MTITIGVYTFNGSLSTASMTHYPPSQASPATLDDLLQRSVWFAELDPEEKARVQDEMREVIVPTGAYLCRRGDVLSHWQGTIDGLLKWAVTGDSGRSVTLAGLSAGSWFGEGAVINRKPVGADVVALRPSRVAQMPIECFERLRATQRSFNDFLVRQLNERMYWFIDGFAAHHLMDTDRLVARALVGLFHPWLHPGSQLHLQVSQDEIANLSGLSRQRCNAALRRMANAGMLEIQYASIEIKDLDGLRHKIASAI